jgi:hypothetical protein
MTSKFTGADPMTSKFITMYNTSELDIFFQRRKYGLFA